MHCVLFRIPPGTTREAVIEKLLADKRVLIAQPLNEFESATALRRAFDDPYCAPAVERAARSTSPRRTTSAAARASAWPSSTPASTPSTPISPAAPSSRATTSTTTPSGFRNDRHGTQVAGLIAASANNGIGIVGVAPDVRLLAFKACWQPSPSSAGRCNSFTLAQALADALAAQAQVINLSLVGPSDPLLEALIAKAIDAGVIVVGAVSADPRFAFPARLPHVLAVTESEDPRHRQRAAARAGAATSSRWCPMDTTTSPRAVRWPPRR